MHVRIHVNVHVFLKVQNLIPRCIQKGNETLGMRPGLTCFCSPLVRLAMMWSLRAMVCS